MSEQRKPSRKKTSLEMEAYVIQWFNTEDPSDMGAEILTDEGDAEIFLETLIQLNYSKTHPGHDLNDPEYDRWDTNETLNIEALRPYIYKTSSKKLTMQFK